MCPHSFLLLYKAYTAELTGISTAPLKFGVVVAGQLHPLGDGGVTVPEHAHIKLHITIEDVLHPVAHHIELQADVGYLIVFCGERDLLRQAAGDSGLQHFHNESHPQEYEPEHSGNPPSQDRLRHGEVQ